MYTCGFRYPDDDSSSYDPDYAYELETYDLPLNCPYRQMVPPHGGPQGFYQGQHGPQGGPPGGPQGGPQGGPPGGPHGAPPSFTPQETHAHQFGAGTYAVDPGAIRPCIYRFAYIWPRRGNGFWAWITFVGRRSISGFRWERNRWRYFGMDLREIRSFQCF